MTTITESDPATTRFYEDNRCIAVLDLYDESIQCEELSRHGGPHLRSVQHDEHQVWIEWESGEYFDGL